MRGHQPSRGCRRTRSTPGTRFVQLRFPPPAARFFSGGRIAPPPLLLPPLCPVELLQLVVRAGAPIGVITPGRVFRRCRISGLIAHAVAVVHSRIVEASRIGAHADPSIAKSLPGGAAGDLARLEPRATSPATYAVCGSARSPSAMPLRIISVRRSAETGRLSRYP